MKTFSGFIAFLLISFLIIPEPVSAQGQNQYKVVVNHEEQYSLWPANRKSPKGWRDTKMKGNQAACQRYIEEVWTDMRPLSVREMDLSADAQYIVIINHEEQYAVWPRKLAVPNGWKATKFQGTLYPCVKYINEVWTDMRPLSVRKADMKRRNE